MVWNDPSRKIVSGIFNSDKKVEQLLKALEERGHFDSEVSVLMTDRTHELYPTLKKESKLPEGTTVGTLSGGLIGAIIGGLTMVGSVLIPGAGLLVAGPIIGILTGGAVGTLTGGLIGALVGAGIPEVEAKYYEQSLKEEGNVLVLVHVLIDDVQEVRDLFKHNGAKEVQVTLEDDANSNYAAASTAL